MTDDDLEALLRGASIDDAPIADDGFTDRVMQRVRAEPRAIDAQTALAALGAQASSARRASRWRWGGIAAGAIVAVAPLVFGGLPLALPAPQALALVLAAAVTAWALAAPALREDR